MTTDGLSIFTKVWKALGKIPADAIPPTPPNLSFFILFPPLVFFFFFNSFPHCAHHSFNQGFYPALLRLPRSVCPEVPLSGRSERGHTPGESACSAQPWSALGYHVANPQGTSGGRTDVTGQVQCKKFQMPLRDANNWNKLGAKKQKLNWKWIFQVIKKKTCGTFSILFDKLHRWKWAYCCSHPLHEVAPPCYRFPWKGSHFVPQPGL